MSGAGKKPEAGSPGVAGWFSSAYRFATDRNDFRRLLEVLLDLNSPRPVLRAPVQKHLPVQIIHLDLLSYSSAILAQHINTTLLFNGNLLVNLGLFAAGVWVARNLSDFDLMSPQPVT